LNRLDSRQGLAGTVRIEQFRTGLNFLGRSNVELLLAA
jgi:hypothetical protein